MPDDNGTTYTNCLDRIQKPLFPKAKNLSYDRLMNKIQCECGGTLFHIELLNPYDKVIGILYECVACGYISTAWSGENDD